MPKGINQASYERLAKVAQKPLTQEPLPGQFNVPTQKCTVIIHDSKLGDMEYEGFEVDGQVYAIIAGEEKSVRLLEKWGLDVEVVK